MPVDWTCVVRVRVWGAFAYLCQDQRHCTLNLYRSSKYGLGNLVINRYITAFPPTTEHRASPTKFEYDRRKVTAPIKSVLSGATVAWTATLDGSKYSCVPTLARLLLILLTGLVATALGLAQPYISKLLIDVALLRRTGGRCAGWRARCVAAAVLGFALNILARYQYVKVSAAMLFDMRVALYRHLQTLSPRFYARWRLGDLVSRLNGDVGEVQRVSADSLLSVVNNVVFLVGSIALMLWLNWRLFLLSTVLLPLVPVYLQSLPAKTGHVHAASSGARRRRREPVCGDADRHAHGGFRERRPV